MNFQNFPSTEKFKSNLDFENLIKPNQKTWRTVGGGIDESPIHPNHHLNSEHHLTPSNHSFQSRFFYRTRSHHLPCSPIIELRKNPFNRNSSNPLPFIKTHKTTRSDSTFNVTSNHHLNSSTQISIHPPQQSSCHSVVKSLALAPISNNIPSRHPFNLRPIRNSTKDHFIINSSYSNQNSTSDAFNSSPQLNSSTIPSLLNPTRAPTLSIDPSQSIHHHEFHLDSIKSIHPSLSQTLESSLPISLEITPSPHQPSSNHTFSNLSRTYSPHISTPLSQPNTPDIKYDFTSPEISGSNDIPTPIQIHPVVPLVTTPETHSFQRQSPHVDQVGLFFEPSGKAFIKYAIPKPQLNIRQVAPPSHSIEKSWDRNRIPSYKNQIPLIHSPSILNPKNFYAIASGSSLEELRYRYWSSQGENVNQVWAELYISKLEREIWKSDSKVDPSLDCIKFCKSNHTFKKFHRRSISAPNFKQSLKPTSQSHLDPTAHKLDLNPTIGSKSHHSPTRKYFPIAKTLSNLISSCTIPPLRTTQGFPCINSKRASTISSINSIIVRPTRYRANSAPRPFINSHHQTRHELKNHHHTLKNSRESGYRIILIKDSNPTTGQSKKLWRKSRSVPNLRLNTTHTELNSPHDPIKTCQSFYSLDPPSSPVEPNSTSYSNIPQSLLDAMFQTLDESNQKSTPSQSAPSKTEKNLIQTSGLIFNHDDPSHLNELPSPMNQVEKSGSKGPLHSLPRFIEPRSKVIMALPPPPRKRNGHPITSLSDFSRISDRSNTQSTPSNSRSNSSWVTTLSQKTYPKSNSPISSKFHRSYSPTLSMLNHFPISTNDHVSTSTPSHPQFFTPILNSLEPSPPGSSSFDHQSRGNSSKKLEHFSSPSSTRPCSLQLESALIDDQHEMDSLAIPSLTDSPLSGFRLNTLPHRMRSTRVTSPQSHHLPHQDLEHNPRVAELQQQQQQQQTRNYPDTVTSNLCTALSSPSGSSHSVIDPDVYINQADLFYQMPASPRRDLIEDYDNHIFQSMQMLNESSIPSPTYGTQSRLIEQILARYTAPRRRKSTHRKQNNSEKIIKPTDEDVSKSTNDQLTTIKFENSPSIAVADCDTSPVTPSRTRRAASALYRIPEIVDAFEARLSASLQGGESPKN